MLADSELVIQALVTTTRKRKLQWKQVSKGGYVSYAGTTKFVLSGGEDEQPILTIVAEDDSQDFSGPDTNELFDNVRAQVICRDGGVLDALNRLG
jgi:hypothetical protein